MSCTCEHTARASRDLTHALRTGDFSAQQRDPQSHVFGQFITNAIAARGIAATGDLPHGLSHDSAVHLLMSATMAIGLGSAREVKLRHRDSTAACSIDLVVYRPGHHCAGEVLMLVEYKPVISSLVGARNAIKQVRTYGQRWNAAHGWTPRLVVVGHRADEWTPAGDVDDVEMGTPAQFVRELRLLATTLAVAEAVAA